MPIDPLADPWGTALLATGSASALLLLVLAAAAVGKRPATWVRVLLGLTLLGFHGSAVAGAMSNLRNGPEGPPAEGTTATASDPDAGEEKAAAPDEPAELDPSANQDDPEPEPSADTDEPHEEAAEATGSDPSEPTDADEAEGEGAPAGPADAPADLATPEPLPEDPEERRTAARLILREGKKIAEQDRSCTDPKKVAEAWIALTALPDDLYAKRQSIIAHRLDKCRRKILWTTTYSVEQNRAAAREALGKAIETRWQDARGLRLFTSVSGKEHEKLRIGSPTLTEDTVTQLWTPALQKELAEAGFDQVTWSDGSNVWRYAVERTTDAEVVRQELAQYGLSEPLRL